ncbi:hypothetical protein GMOD_00008026 [Pyrenophora seminiperda CCB06]|uniref:Uncharacterized protein n=1 Tax=Pyrenophora seminiperda CCB06 TaxID=1302712 RepID=A0A3M7MGD2_9PLEO|nr:hypothetical protein GMOD_00008026 [Pyrenophora seminiperda CCB06]
MNTNIYIYLN